MNRTPRQVGLKTILDLLKQKNIHFSVGIIFTIIPFAVGFIIFLVTSLTDTDIPKIDYGKVNENGIRANATITDIETQSNITINNEHPSILSYAFKAGNNEIKGKFRTLDPDRVNRMNIGDTIEVKYLADGSIVVGLEPFEFPFDTLADILIPFLIIGLILLTLLYLRIRNQIALYQQGAIMDAELISMTPKNRTVSGFGQGVTVHYQYKTTQGQSILGKSFTSDNSILSTKKQGDMVKIFVSVDNESKSCLIPKLESIRNNWKIEG